MPYLSRLDSVDLSARSATRQALIDAAVQLVRERGLNATSVNDLCAHAGVSKGAFFHHFDSKDALMAAAALYWGARANAMFDQVAPEAETAAERTGTDKVWKQVHKDYPIATHAHTVEFRLQNKSNLYAIHTSVKSAWMSGRGRTIKISEVQ